MAKMGTENYPRVLIYIGDAQLEKFKSKLFSSSDYMFRPLVDVNQPFWNFKRQICEILLPSR